MNTISLLLAILAMTPCDKITIEARLDENLTQVHGETHCVTPANENVVTSNYLTWLNEKESKALNDVNTPWFYPNGYQPGKMLVTQKSHPFSHRFITTIPPRAGTLGRSKQGTYLLGGWHPSYTHAGVLIRQNYEYKIEIPQGYAAFIGDTLYKPGAQRVVTGTFNGKHLPMVFSQHFRIWSKGDLRLVHPQEELSTVISNTVPFGLRDIARDQGPSRDKEILHTIELLHKALPELPAHGSPTTFIIGPARKTLAEWFDGGALISDRAFQILNWERLKRFHRNTLWRYLIQASLADLLLNREAPEDIDWVADALAAGLRDLSYQRTYGDKEWASDVLSKFAIIPEIDALIHAPQVTLASTYFLAVDETSGLDVELSRFATLHAPGKLYTEKLVDRYGQTQVTAFLLKYLSGEKRFDEMADTEFGSDSDGVQKLEGWKSMPYPKVDYFLEASQSQGNQKTVTIGLRGAQDTTDTITVEAHTANGPIRKSREGPGDITFTVDADLEQVVIDPDARLVEHLHTQGEEARFNNYKNPRWRFLLNNISGLFAVTNNDLSLAADFSLRKIYDQTYRYRFSLHYTPSSIGGSGGITYAFGPELTALRLSHAIAIRGAYSYLRDEGIGLATGHLGSLRLAYSHDTRISPYFAFEGHGWNAGLTSGYHQTTEDQGAYASFGASTYGIIKLPGRQGLLGRIRGDVMIGTPPSQATLRLGGLYRGSRGYESDAARSDTFRGLATIEHRHAWFTGARIDFWGGLMWSRLEGAFFANATYLPENDTNCSSPFFFDIGYGLRFIGDVLNISPAAIVVDVGMPLNPCAKRSEHQPVTVYLSFIQSLSGF